MKDTSTRSPARRAVNSQAELLGLAEGLFESCVLFTLNKLGVFQLLAEGPRKLTAIADALDSRADSLERVLNAGVVLGLLEAEAGGAYCIPERWEAVLSDASSEAYLGNWLGFLDYLCSCLTDLDKAALAGGPTVNLLKSKDQRDITEFTLAMHNYAAVRGREIVHFLDTSGCETLLDLGTGPGTYAFHLGAHNPALKLYLLDLPEILAVTREVEARYALHNDITYLPVDVTTEEIPGTYDLVMISNTLHMLGEAESRRLLRRVIENVAPGGSLVVQFQYMQEDRRGGRWPVFLDLVQLCITEHGRNHAVGETTKWMQDAGFTDVAFSPMSLLNTNGYIRGYRR
jgi:O-methyltransferase involved in polyketide biosynthesis